MSVGSVRRVRINEEAEEKIIPKKEDYKPPSQAAIKAAQILATSIARRKGLPVVNLPVDSPTSSPAREEEPQRSPSLQEEEEEEEQEEEDKAAVGSQPHSPSPHQSPLPYPPQRWYDEEEEEEKRHGAFRDRPF
jgi:hypothetical protein